MAERPGRPVVLGSEGSKAVVLAFCLLAGTSTAAVDRAPPLLPGVTRCLVVRDDGATFTAASPRASHAPRYRLTASIEADAARAHGAAPVAAVSSGVGVKRSRTDEPAPLPAAEPPGGVDRLSWERLAAVGAPAEEEHEPPTDAPAWMPPGTVIEGTNPLSDKPATAPRPAGTLLRLHWRVVQVPRLMLPRTCPMAIVVATGSPAEAIARRVASRCGPLPVAAVPTAALGDGVPRADAPDGARAGE
jgi:hypothetical protein